MDLTPILKGHAPGEWVALSRDLAKVLGAGRTPQEAIRLAKAVSTRTRMRHKPGFVLLCVPDPSSVCVY